MTTKAEFNAEEWSKVASLPFVAGLTVIAADRGGTVRETVALAKAIAEEQRDTDNPELVRELLAERPNPQSLLGDREQKLTKEELTARVDQALGEAVELLEAKATPEEVDAYKQLCLEVAQKVAERTKSGDFLGIGGERVSADEQAAIEHLRATLGA
jgi:redox-regulated HSP33 family molecular chaperone